MFKQKPSSPKIDSVSVVTDSQRENSFNLVDALYERAFTRPDSTVLSDQAGRVSASEALSSARLLAARLHAVGCKSGDRVALFLAPGRDVLVAMSAVWMLGAIIVSIDLDWPDVRIYRVLGLTRCRYGVLRDSSGAKAAHLSGILGGPVVNLGIHVDEESDSSDIITFLPSRPPDRSAAYVVFTSGSTGEPKAIEGRHDSLHHFLSWQTNRFSMGNSVISAHLAPLTFDVTFRDLWTPIIAGGHVAVPSLSTKESPQALVSWISEQGVTLLHIVPSLLRVLLNACEGDNYLRRSLEGLDYVFCSGETLYKKDVVRLRSLGSAKLVICNLFGASETTMTRLAYIIQPSDPLTREEAIPLGKPIPDCKCLISEDDELIIETFHPTNGYLDPATGDPVPFDLFDLDGSGRMCTRYATGDRVRRDNEGIFHFLGRRDSQIKVRGNRVDLAEVQAALSHVPGITDVCVLITPGLEETDGSELAAFYAGVKSVPSNSEVRRFLSNNLPAYMVPRHIEQIERLPLQSNGKIDRVTLLARLSGNTQEFGDANVQLTDVDKVLATTLGFKALGGVPLIDQGCTSLKAMYLVAEIERRFGRRLSSVDVLRMTPANLLTAIDVAEFSDLQGDKATTDLRRPLSIYLKPFLSIADYPPAQAAYNQRLAYEIHPPPEPETLSRALTLLEARHPILRSRYRWTGNGPEQDVVDTNLSETILRIDNQARRDWLADFDRVWATPFDLANDPAFRVVLYDQENDRAVLALCFNHIIADIVGLKNLCTDLIAIYSHLSLQGVDAQLPLEYEGSELTLDPVDEEGLGRWPELDAAAAYWKSLLSPLPKPLTIASEKRPIFRSYRGETRTIICDIDVKASVVLSGIGNATPFAVLASAFAEELHQLTGQNDIVFGFPILMRDRASTYRAAGCFLNMMPMRIDFGRRLAFADLVRLVQIQIYNANRFKTYPFNWIVRDLDVKTNLSRSPLFDATISYADAGSSAYGNWNLDGHSISSILCHPPTAKYDLSCNLSDIGGRLQIDLETNTSVVPGRVAETFATRFGTRLSRLGDN